jgi:hypothetical protein
VEALRIEIKAECSRSQAQSSLNSMDTSHPCCFPCSSYSIVLPSADAAEQRQRRLITPMIELLLQTVFPLLFGIRRSVRYRAISEALFYSIAYIWKIFLRISAPHDSTDYTP